MEIDYDFFKHILDIMAYSVSLGFIWLKLWDYFMQNESTINTFPFIIGYFELWFTAAGIGFVILSVLFIANHVFNFKGDEKP